MKDIFKRITLFVLCTALILPAVQVNITLASAQTAVPNLTIARQPGTVAGTHNVTLSWGSLTMPTLDANDEPEGALTPASDYNAYIQRYADYGAQGYDITYNDVTRGTGAGNVQNQPVPPLTSYQLNNIAPNKGSLYSFKVIPYHYHPQYSTATTSWVYPGTKITPAAGQIREALLLTDIEVDAQGSNDTLTVTWDNPMFGNTQAFQSFKIYVARGATDDTRRNASIVLTVDVSQCTRIAADALRDKGPRLSYDIRDTDKIFSGFYSVAVEPCDPAGNTIRDKADATTVTIGGTPYPLTYSSYSTTPYEKQGAHVSIELSVSELGSESRMLNWGDLTSLGNVSEIAIFSNTDKSALDSLRAAYDINAAEANNNRPTPAVVISSGSVMGYPVIAKDVAVYYMIVVTVIDQSVASYNPSNVAIVAPSTVKITPTTPDIHHPIDRNADNTAITLFWDAFRREGEQTNTITIDSFEFTYDPDVIYDIYIVDDLVSFPNFQTYPPTTGARPVTINTLTLGTPIPHAKDGIRVPSYSYEFTSFVDKNGTSKLFEKNRMYYIALVARKQYIEVDGSIGYLPSAPSFATIYIPVTGDISSPPMLAKPPLSVRKDENGNDAVTTSTIDVAWIEEWSEVYDYSRVTNDPSDPYDPNNANIAWQTKAVRDGQMLYYGEDTDGVDGVAADFYSELDLLKVREILGIDSEVSKIPARTLSVSGCEYEAKVITYTAFMQSVNNAGSYDDYLETLMAESVDENGWSSVTPMMDSNGKPYIRVNVPQSNAAYVILLRAYRTTYDGKINYGYANFVTAATIPPVTPMPITPTPPVIKPVPPTDEWVVSPTDTTISLMWENTNTIDYEIVYSNVYYTDIETQYNLGIPLSYDYVAENSVIRLVNGVEYRYLTVEGLLPDTEYYFWGRARSQTGEESSWSNPAEERTLDIAPPQPPRGFGIVSETDLGLINQNNGTRLTPRDKNYLVMEWMKDTNDPNEDGGGTNTAIADILSHPNITGAYVVQFKDLISNLTYYFRAKTILTITLGEDMKTRTSYAYLVQISADPGFVEYEEIYVPGDPTPAEGATFKQSESQWTRTIHYKTNVSSDDYDTDFDPDLYPLPDEDFEIIYNGATGTLTYRFRTNLKDEAGNYDNMVDQRLVTKLVNQQVHNYLIDVTKYNDSRILRRVIEVPYSLLKAFEERKISFGIRAGDVTLTLPPQAMDTALVQSVPDYGASAGLQVVFVESPSNMPMLEPRSAYAMTPQEVSLYLTTPTQYVKMPYAGAALDVHLKLDNRFDLQDLNVGAYVKNAQTEGWSYVPSKYEKESGEMSFKTQPGIYAAIARETPATVNFDQSTPYMLNVASSFAITDLGVYNGNLPAGSNQLLNVMEAILTGNRQLAINKAPDETVVSTLHKAGINIQPGATSVTREQGIASMVRLYEIKMGRQIKPTYNLSTTPYTDTGSVQQAYQNAMLKAAEIDMLNGKTAVRPKDILTVGDMFELADVIISDAGL